MSSSALKSIGVPIALLFDAEQHRVTVEMRNGEVYRGVLIEGKEQGSSKCSLAVQQADEELEKR
jgi:hypothetical protein